MSENRINLRALGLFDLDGVIFEKTDEYPFADNGWLILTHLFGADVAEHGRIYMEFDQNKSSDPEKAAANRKDMVGKILNLWKESLGRDIHETDLEERFNLLPDFVSAYKRRRVREIIKDGVLPTFITGGLEDAARIVAGLFKIQELAGNKKYKGWYGNSQFIFDEKRKVIGFKHKENIKQTKREQASMAIAQAISLGVLKEPFPRFAIGDDASDELIFDVPQIFAAAYNSRNGELISMADYDTNSWPALRKWIRDVMISETVHPTR